MKLGIWQEQAYKDVAKRFTCFASDIEEVGVFGPSFFMVTFFLLLLF
jgi:hypothetical protein